MADVDRQVTIALATVPGISTNVCVPLTMLRRRTVHRYGE